MAQHNELIHWWNFFPFTESTRLHQRGGLGCTLKGPFCIPQKSLWWEDAAAVINVLLSLF